MLLGALALSELRACEPGALLSAPMSPQTEPTGSQTAPPIPTIGMGAAGCAVATAAGVRAAAAAMTQAAVPI